MNALEKLSLSSIKIFFKTLWTFEGSAVHVGRSRVDGKTLALILVGGVVAYVCVLGSLQRPITSKFSVRFQGDPSSCGRCYNWHPLCVHQSFL